MKISFPHISYVPPAVWRLKRLAPRRRAFTILELVIVVAVALTVTLAAVGAYSNVRRSRSVRSAAESMQALMEGARAHAVTTNGYYRMVVQLRDPSTAAVATQFWLDEIYPPDGSTTDPTPALPEAAKTPKLTTPERLPEDVRLVDAAVRPREGAAETTTTETDSFVVIRFFPDGSSDEATIRLVPQGSLAENNPRTYIVRLLAPTARPKVLSAEQQ